MTIFYPMGSLTMIAAPAQHKLLSVAERSLGGGHIYKDESGVGTKFSFREIFRNLAKFRQNSHLTFRKNVK